MRLLLIVNVMIKKSLNLHSGITDKINVLLIITLQMIQIFCIGIFYI